MKKVLCLVLCLFVVFAFCGCESAVQDEIEFKGEMLDINWEKKTLTGKDFVMDFDISKNQVKLFFPEKLIFTLNINGSGYSGGFNDLDAVDSDFQVFDFAQDLHKIAYGNKASGGNIAVGLLLVVLGLVNLIKPKFVWYINHGFAIKEATPSDGYLTFVRVSGVLLLIVGVIVIL